MFSFAFDRRNNVMLARIHGTFDGDTMFFLDEACSAFIDAEGPGHGIVDFSDVAKVDMSTAALARRAQYRPLNPGFERILVVPQDEFVALAEGFVASQGAVGLSTPRIVRSMAEAEALLGLSGLVFKPIETSWVIGLTRLPS